MTIELTAADVAHLELRAVRVDEQPDADGPAEYDDTSLSEAHLGARIAADYLSGKFVAWGRNAWSRWDGKRWERCTDTTVFEAIRIAALDVHRQGVADANRAHERAHETARGLKDDAAKTAREAADAAHRTQMKALGALHWASKLGAIQRVARGRLEVRQDAFDTHPDLLNVGNGIVDLRTGDLLAHDPALMFSKVSAVKYRPDAEHDDWAKALTALPDEVAAWMQLRFGQAATGYATQDDMVPFLRGGGENGKSTVLVGVTKALGDFAVQVPDKVLLASPSDHPTELMTLKGARFAYIEELPEGDYLNAQRLKKAAGTDNMTARYIGQDNVQWSATHSLFVTTNYEVQVDAVDWGTWRRLALVMFPYTFDGSDPDHPSDPTLRLRMGDGVPQHEAALAWLVEGAQRWYENGRVIPPMPQRVKDDTAKWRYDANHAARFIDEHLEADPNSAVRPADVYAAFVDWADAVGIRKWSERLFWQRARQHEWFRTGAADKADGSVRTAGWRIHRQSAAPLKPQERLVTGVRFVNT